MEEGEAAKRPLLVKEIKLDNNGQASAYNSYQSSSVSASSSSSSSVTPVVVFSTLIVGCGSFALGNLIGYSSPAESGIIKDIGLTLAEYSLFASFFIVGSIIGGIWSGRIADVIGRRGAMGVPNLLSIAGWLLIAFAKV
ncbi:Major facilitator, sugar transporter-like [Trema orientale]|uniref:Major facilitator, sugar transporter-like n=1 Tax=Trema orientale TaxID=63057 RepID=A0A2P5E223_TREOI|nr:Major facilitator, sugar transporter-like [Trema orientale]